VKISQEYCEVTGPRSNTFSFVLKVANASLLGTNDVVHHYIEN
jgi:hypothetical protein